MEINVPLIVIVAGFRNPTVNDAAEQNRSAAFLSIQNPFSIQ